MAPSQVPGTLRPTCGTRQLTDVEIAADAARVADFKTRRGLSRAGTLTTITTCVHVIHNGAEGRISARTIRDQMSVLKEGSGDDLFTQGQSERMSIQWALYREGR